MRGHAVTLSRGGIASLTDASDIGIFFAESDKEIEKRFKARLRLHELTNSRSGPGTPVRHSLWTGSSRRYCFLLLERVGAGNEVGGKRLDRGSGKQPTMQSFIGSARGWDQPLNAPDVGPSAALRPRWLVCNERSRRGSRRAQDTKNSVGRRPCRTRSRSFAP